MENGELHVLNKDNQLLGICRRKVSFSLKQVLTVDDAQGNVLMHLNLVSVTSRDYVLEMTTGARIAQVRRSRPADWKQMLLEFKDDRLEIIFEPNTPENIKALGISAIMAAYLLIRQF